MDSCHRDHPSCSSQHEQAMPKRLIAISLNNLRLVETNSERQKYVALSYKWGGPQPVQAANATLSSLMNGFRMEDLPHSLRDAVILTQKLGLSYLWIDALCIIQDNEIDKGAEVSKMATIYENAAVTIASSRTNSAIESFLSPRTEFNGIVLMTIRAMSSLDLIINVEMDS
jgi:Heterokaryon incompatibility protein (HET)